MKIKNRKEDLKDLNFHDSAILNFSFNVNDYNMSAQVTIMYYNWEGNNDNKEEWITKNLQISIDDLTAFESHNINSVSLTPYILDVTFDSIELCHETEIIKAEEFIIEIPEEMKNSINNRSDSLCIRFNLNQYGDEAHPYDQAHLLLAGYGINIKWLDENTSAATHFYPGENVEF